MKSLASNSKSLLVIIAITKMISNCIVIVAKLYGILELECKNICGLNKLNKTLNISIK